MSTHIGKGTLRALQFIGIFTIGVILAGCGTANSTSVPNTVGIAPTVTPANSPLPANTPTVLTTAISPVNSSPTSSSSPTASGTSAASSPSTGQQETLTGIFSVIWPAPPPPGSTNPPADPQYFLGVEGARSTRLIIDEKLLENLGGITGLNQKKVIVVGEKVAPLVGSTPTLKVVSMRLA